MGCGNGRVVRSDGEVSDGGKGMARKQRIEQRKTESCAI